MTLEDYKAIIRPMMSERRYNHCVNVSIEAVRLAKKYGADVKKAEVAGILHDITKEVDFENQLQIIEHGDIILTDVEKSTNKLWHAISGSVYIQTKLGINDQEIIDAIRYHTTGRANMSLLEKVIFLADFTSAERNYPDVEVIRQKADISLEEGMLYGIQFTLNKLLERQSLLCEDAIDAYNEILINR
ncbi:MAG: HD domain-containing protein [Ruminococcaceae bacterium]|nr:HD domain-containing protein [Oscillospiraceae bacterium]